MRPPASWNNARVTLGIAAVTALAWLLVTTVGAELAATYWGGFIPARVSGTLAGGPLAPVWLTPLTATLVHADILHLAFNLLMLLFCGRAIEPILGAKGVLILYLVGAYAAAAAQFGWSPGERAPMIGASGAVSALLGAYAMFFGRHRIKVANNAAAVAINALWLAAAWIGLQLLIGFASAGSGIMIAIAAHIGGFLAGLLLARPLLMLRWRGA
ncbi:rhomboid family intramembrane serine protease [Sphingomonas parva]|uniref:Rhomboid family intramembrane serine protease n=1 Tax=Sphingomonas parva TaxID=2555898 RepID=A0A4Y8ZW19_9SPHN|nr:rhomboid family intramembrane serine protease [Sphingomonas parva]TFI60231.1 rhomboid family intramembrane serine protease [Sphingomonas parva]